MLAMYVTACHREPRALMRRRDAHLSLRALRMQSGWMALHFAAKKHHHDTILELLRHRADYSLTTNVREITLDAIWH